MEFAGLLPCPFGKVGASGGVDDASGGIDNKPTIGGEAVFADFVKTATLGSNAGDKKETVGGNGSDLREHIGLGGTNDIHHIVGGAPLLGGLEDLLEKMPAGGFVFKELEIEGAFVGGEGEKDDPLVGIDGEGGDGVFAHIGGNGDCVEIEIALWVEKGFGILLGGVAYVTAFGVGNGEDGLAQLVEVVHGLFELDEAGNAHAFVEGEVGFVGDAIVDGGVDDGFVEEEGGIGIATQMVGDLIQIGIESDTKEGFAFAD